MTISVITPVYNSERYIADAIESVLAQGCLDRVEHIIIDGQSTDGTVDIIRDYASHHDHIRWISEPDRGQSDAMNKGIAMATGDILGILNADDYYEPEIFGNVLARFEALLEQTLLLGNCNVWDHDGTLQYCNRPGIPSLYDILHAYQLPVNPSAYFYHRSLHARIGGYDVENHQSMDIDFLVRAFRHANVEYVDAVWGNFRKLENTKTVAAEATGALDRAFAQLRAKHMPRLPAHLRLYFKAKPYLNWLRSRAGRIKNQTLDYLLK